MPLYGYLLALIGLGFLIGLFIHLFSRLRQSQEGSSRQLTNQFSEIRVEIGRHLEESLKRFQEANRHVGDRLDNAARVVGEVQNRLGKLEVATQQVHAIGRDIVSLQESLRSPKFRGGFGEFMLENLLSQILPPDSYVTQHHFRTGDIVDAVIRTREGLIPVDSKFPLPNFKKMIEAQSEEEKASCRKEFIRDVRKHVDDMAKYIRPEEGTLPFALMYIPAENVYYETIIKGDETDGDFLDYAQKKRIFPVSPNSFYAYLQTIAIGLRGMKIEEWAKELDANLQHLRGDLSRFTEEFSQVGGHLKNLRQKYESAEKKLDRFQENLNQLEVPTETERLKVVSENS